MNRLTCLCDHCRVSDLEKCTKGLDEREQSVLVSMRKDRRKDACKSAGWLEMTKRGKGIIKHDDYKVGNIVIVAVPAHLQAGTHHLDRDLISKYHFSLGQIAELPTDLARKGGSRSRPIGGDVKLFIARETEPGRSYYFPSKEICRDGNGEMKMRAQCHDECIKKHVYAAQPSDIMRGPWPITKFLVHAGHPENDRLNNTDLESGSLSSSSSSHVHLILDPHTIQLIKQQYARDNKAFDNLFSEIRGRENIWERAGNVRYGR